jgi:4,5-dihydroxyphthalate decarboxylase
MLARGDDSLVAIPVVTSRTFRHASLYVRNDAGIATPADLAGRRVGVPEWALTPAIYARAVLQHEYGVDLRAIQWVQAGVDEPGRLDKMQLKPEGFSITPAPTRSLTEMLLAGELDGMISARPPRAVDRGDPRIRPAFADLHGAELAYWRRTKFHPIMHVIAIRRDDYERNRWIARNLFNAFEEAKRRAIARILDTGSSHFPIPWLSHHVAGVQAEMGADFWPYGIEPNRVTLEAFCRFAFEQGACARRLTVDELFAPEMQGAARI